MRLLYLSRNFTARISEMCLYFWMTKNYFIRVGYFDRERRERKEYVKYYNNERPAYALQYKSPIQYKTEMGFV